MSGLPDALASILTPHAAGALAWAVDELPKRHAEGGTEQIAVIDAESGGILLALAGGASGVRIPAAEASRVARGRGNRSLVVVHTHARDGGFSSRDAALFIDEPRWLASVLCNAENGSLCWLVRGGPGDTAGFRYDGHAFAGLLSSVRRVAAARGVPCRRVPLGLRLRPASRQALFATIDASYGGFVADLNRAHGTAFSYGARREPVAEIREGERLWCEIGDVDTRRAYSATCHAEARRALRPVAVAVMPAALAAVALVPGGAPWAAEASLAADAALVGLLALALPTPLRRGLGRRVLESRTTGDTEGRERRWAR